MNPPFTTRSNNAQTHHQVGPKFVITTRSSGAKQCEHTHTAVANGWPGQPVLDAHDWSPALNDAFVEELITQQRRVYLGSPVEGNLIQRAGDFAGQPTIFAGELGMLDAAGYTRVGDYLVPPG